MFPNEAHINVFAKGIQWRKLFWSFSNPLSHTKTITFSIIIFRPKKKKKNHMQGEKQCNRDIKSILLTLLKILSTIGWDHAGFWFLVDDVYYWLKTQSIVLIMLCQFSSYKPQRKYSSWHFLPCHSIVWYLEKEWVKPANLHLDNKF